MAENENEEEVKKTTEEVLDEILEKVVEESDPEPVEDDLDALKDKLLRLQADFENYRKRMAKERLELYKYGSENLVQDLLDVLDNFERAMDSAQAATDVQTMMQGIVMVQKQLHDVLQNKGVQKMNVKGQTFDPNIHEALIYEENDELDDGLIIEELQSGYQFHEKVIRCAKVKVAKSKEPKEENDNE